LNVEGATLSFAAYCTIAYSKRFKVNFPYKLAWMWWVIHIH